MLHSNAPVIPHAVLVGTQLPQHLHLVNIFKISLIGWVGERRDQIQDCEYISEHVLRRKKKHV